VTRAEGRSSVQGAVREPHRKGRRQEMTALAAKSEKARVELPLPRNSSIVSDELGRVGVASGDCRHVAEGPGKLARVGQPTQ
jgi:hypothetical protein